jgi:hypothetical protein
VSSLRHFTVLVALSLQTALVAQRPAGRTTVSIPSIGCLADGQIAEIAASANSTVTVSMSGAQSLAFYKAANTTGVFAPRGWYCFGIYGSGGDALLVSPGPISRDQIFGNRKGFSGPMIEISHRYGDTSGRFDVAEIISRLFPAYRAFVTRVQEEFDQPPDSFPAGPYPRDEMTYRSNKAVEYKTPAQTEGLGTRSLLIKDASPIQGVAMLVGDTPDLLVLAVRLPPNLARLAPAIIRQTELDAGH